MTQLSDEMGPYRDIATNAIPEVTNVRFHESTEEKIKKEHEFGDSLTEAPRRDGGRHDCKPYRGVRIDRVCVRELHFREFE